MGSVCVWHEQGLEFVADFFCLNLPFFILMIVLAGSPYNNQIPDDDVINKIKSSSLNNRYQKNNNPQPPEFPEHSYNPSKYKNFTPFPYNKKSCFIHRTFLIITFKINCYIIVKLLNEAMIFKSEEYRKNFFCKITIQKLNLNWFL